MAQLEPRGFCKVLSVVVRHKNRSSMDPTVLIEKLNRIRCAFVSDLKFARMTPHLAYFTAYSPFWIFSRML
jgi:hypothetical protein